jgi:GntR family transcriptional repressor for pyruvate dehydrogenase complex
MARSNVTSAAAQKLQEMIHTGQLQPDQQLPSQLELSRQLGISRASLRETISMLETLGFLRIEPGRGTFIASTTPSGSGQLAPRGMVGRHDKQDIYQTRLYLESLVVNLVAPEITQATIARLNEHTTLMCAAWDRNDLVGVVDHDRDFHHAIWAACPNKLLLDMCMSAADEFAATRSYPLPATRPQRFAESANEHFALVDALARHDGNRAAGLMQRHIRNTAAAAGIMLTPLPTPDPSS